MNVPNAPTGSSTASNASVVGDRRIAVWLFGMAAMVFAMVVIGGLTRLTESGLSITDWRPLTGWLPPMSEDAWNEVFARYREIPEYTEINAGMSLAEFKQIFWLEYIHRLWGRLLGAAFVVPFLWFAVSGVLDRRRFAVLTGLLALGGLQGFLGWYMVQSGLSERTDVSQYRLALHLGVALVIYVGLLKAAFWFRRGCLAHPSPTVAVRGWLLSLRVLMVLTFVTIIAGAFLAGTDGGLTYNTFPLMDGELVPTRLYEMNPWFISAFEDITTIQFNHRLLATLTVAGAILAWILSPRLQNRALCRSIAFVGMTGFAQYLLGVATLLSIVRLEVAVFHQAGAVLLLTALTVAIDRSKGYPKP